MPDGDETRHSLILRLRDRSDAEAWGEFVAIYEPLVYRLVRGKGLQHADAEDLTQQALAAVASTVDRYDSAKGSFRGWLCRIARNMLINYLTRPRPGDRGTGRTDFLKLLEQAAAPGGEETTRYVLERRREVFRWAAEQVRPTVQEASWRAFWRTAVEGVSTEDCAEEFGLSAGAVYAIRSRVMAKLRRKAAEWEACEAAEGESGP